MTNPTIPTRMLSKCIWGILSLAAFLYQPPQAKANLEGLLEGHLKWAIFHEGCSVYDGNTRRSAVEIKNCALRVQQHNPSSYQIIAAATDTEILLAAAQAANEIPGEFQLYLNFVWVMDHEGQRAGFRQLKSQGNYRLIREIYYRAQSHNPNARNLLAACSDNQISGLIS